MRGLRLRVRSWSPPDPRGGVVIVHGLGDHGLRYAALAEALAHRGYAVVAPDLRGHGESEGRQGDVGSFADFTTDVGESVSVLRRSIPQGAPLSLVGHSMGGLVVLRYLQGEGRSPSGLLTPSFTPPPRVVGAVLSAPWIQTAQSIPGWKRLAGRVALRVLPGIPFRMDLSPTKLTRDPEQRQLYEEDPLVHGRCSSRLFAEVEQAQQDAWNSAQGMKLPLMLVVPDGDPVVDSSATLRLAQRFPGGQVDLLHIPGGRHEPFHDLGREDTIDTTVAWLDERMGGRQRNGPGEREGFPAPRMPRRGRSARAGFTPTTDWDDDG